VGIRENREAFSHSCIFVIFGKREQPKQVVKIR
jgi:hypothetical protein